MKQSTSVHLGSALLGAIFGGILVVMVAKAIPTLLTRMMSGVMENMRTRMEACGCNSQEMCQKMMAACPVAPKET